VRTFVLICALRHRTGRFPPRLASNLPSHKEATKSFHASALSRYATPAIAGLFQSQSLPLSPRDALERLNARAQDAVQQDDERAPRSDLG